MTISPIPVSIGKYKVIGLVSENTGQARIFRVADPNLNAELVLKLAHAPLTRDSADAHNIIQEARILLELQHPHLAKVYALDVFDNHPYVVMEYVRGQNLHQYATKHELSPLKAAEIVATLSLAVSHAHRHGVSHCDIKPENIVIRAADGQPTLVDFGIARIQNALVHQIDAEGLVFGSIEYMAPERARGEADVVNELCDVFGLGGVLFRLLMGRAPFKAADTKTAWKLAEECNYGPEALEEHEPRIPKSLIKICEKAMSANPDGRYASAESLAHALKTYVRPRMRLKRIFMGLCAFVVIAALLWFVGRPKTALTIDYLRLYVTSEGNAFSFDVLDRSNSQLIVDRQVRAGRDAIAIDGQLSEEAHWYLLWHDTNGKVIALDEDSSAALAYPASRSDRVTVDPTDPPGTHFLIILASRQRREESPGGPIALISKSVSTPPPAIDLLAVGDSSRGPLKLPKDERDRASLQLRAYQDYRRKMTRLLADEYELVYLVGFDATSANGVR